jgi:hypothetical protein
MEKAQSEIQSQSRLGGDLNSSRTWLAFRQLLSRWLSVGIC